MKKLFFCACILSAVPTVANTTLPSEMYLNLETSSFVFQKEFKVPYQDSNLNSSSNNADFEKAYLLLIEYVVEQKQDTPFQSVSFTTLIDPKDKQIIIRDIDFHQDNSYAVALEKLLNQNSQDQLDAMGITLEATQAYRQEDLSKCKDLAKNILETINSTQYKAGNKIVSTIDINYQNIQ
ncbi:hypothetical protein [Myroides sp. LJL119]